MQLVGKKLFQVVGRKGRKVRGTQPPPKPAAAKAKAPAPKPKPKPVKIVAPRTAAKVLTLKEGPLPLSRS